MSDHMMSAEEAYNLRFGKFPMEADSDPMIRPFSEEQGWVVQMGPDSYTNDMPDAPYEDAKLLAHAGRALRAIVAQAETMETLSRLLSGAEEAAIAREERIERLQAALREADRNWHDALGSEYEYTREPEGFVSTYEALLPGDMEAPK